MTIEAVNRPSNLSSDLISENGALGVGRGGVEHGLSTFD